MSNKRMRNMPSSASTKQSSQQSTKKLDLSPTNYQLVLSQYIKIQQSEKPQKSTSSSLSERNLIQTLQKQIIELQRKVDILTQENKKLKQIKENTFEKVFEKYNQLKTFSHLKDQLQQLQIENISMKQCLSQLKIDFQISISPLKKIINQFQTVPIKEIQEIQELRFNQQHCELLLQKQKCELLNIERTNLIEYANQLEKELCESKSRQDITISN